MALLTLLSLLANPSIPVYDLPPVVDDADVIIVMMHDGLLPQDPWEGMTSYQREEFWTLGCSGMMLQRAAWSGYVLICSQGTWREFLDTAESLAGADCETDNSALAAGLELEPASSCTSMVLVFSVDGTDQPPDTLPLRRSVWLAGEPDTVMINSPQEGNAFFWTGSHDNDFSSAAWRGTGTGLVPTGSGSVELDFTCVHGSVPSNLRSISVEPHPFDDRYMATWGAALSAVDSLIASIYPRENDSDHLLWIRGEGVGRPWRTSSSPLPPPSASFRVRPQEDPRLPHPLGNVDPSEFPNAVQVRLPGRLATPSSGPVIQAILERAIGRDLYTDFGEEVFFDVTCGLDGEVSIWLIPGPGEPLLEDCRASLDETLRNSFLVPPGSILIQNAVTRASFLEGVKVDSLGVREVSMELMNILYPSE